MGDLYLPGAASLLEQLDTKVMIILADGRHLVGLLRSFDQFLNLVLENTSERILLPGEGWGVTREVRGEELMDLVSIESNSNYREVL